MKIRYKYRYASTFSYDSPICRQSVRLRHRPMECSWITIESARLSFFPATNIRETHDSFGNPVQWGEILGLHDRLSIISEGIAVQTGAYLEPGTPSGIYKAYTRLTQCSPSMAESFDFARDIGDIPSSANEIMHALHSSFCYAPGSTDCRTSASEAWESGKGVCQDLAHIMIAACRRVGIAARYVAGLIEGVGRTHAWVEVNDGEKWMPFDPTHDRRPEYGYIKIAHGRDASDCSTVRGLISAHCLERMSVCCSMKTIQ